MFHITKDESGNTYERLTVINKAYSKNGKAYWNCKCSCGNNKVVMGKYLRNGDVRSCGCLAKENLKKRSTSHGLAKTRAYQVYNNMIKRCTDPTYPQYKDYGGRGIKVCDRWLKSVAHFVEDMGERPKGYTIERIDNDGNYTPENCKWITKKEQSYNRRNNRNITFGGKTQAITKWAKETGLGAMTIQCRIDRYGWSIEKALTTPSKRKVKEG